MATLFNNKASELVALAALDGYVDVLEKEVKSARSLQLLLRSPPKGHKPSSLLARNGAVAHAKALAKALLRKTTDDGDVDGKSYRGEAEASVTLAQDAGNYVFSDGNVPGDYGTEDMTEILSVVLKNGTSLSATNDDPPTAAGSYHWNPGSSTLTFHADDDLNGAVVRFAYETDHDQDSALRHVADELEEHVSEANLAEDPS